MSPDVEAILRRVAVADDRARDDEACRAAVRRAVELVEREHPEEAAAFAAEIVMLGWAAALDV